MSPLLTSFLIEQPLFRIIQGLMTSGRPRHLRDLALQYQLSPAGVSDIVRRLKRAGLVLEERKSNRRYLRLQISSEEQACFKTLFSLYELAQVRKRAPRFSVGAADKLAGMDEAYVFYMNRKKVTTQHLLVTNRTHMHRVAVSSLL